VDINYRTCTDFTRAEEGGYVDDRRDSGNWTGAQVGVGQLIGSNFGVGAPALVSWLGDEKKATRSLMETLPVATYDAIARNRYWQPLQCDRLRDGVDCMVFDFGWNRGVGASIKVLQTVLQLKADGIFGPVTRSALMEADPEVLISTLNIEQIKSYRRLSNFSIYGKGWLARTSRRTSRAMELYKQSASQDA
jgi:lysozyme family protein